MAVVYYLATNIGSTVAADGDVPFSLAEWGRNQDFVFKITIKKSFNITYIYCNCTLPVP